MASLKRDKSFLLALLSFLLFVTVHAQTIIDKPTKLAEQFHAISENAPAEIVYIQTSKDLYETGEDLWFKVYLLDSKYLMPSLLSKTLYLQLLNSTTRKAVWEEKYEIQDGFANGRVYLESSLPEGDYLLAAYTENSFYNDTSEFKAVKRIIVKQDMTSPTPIATKSQTPVATGSNHEIQFTTFPEGGSLVSGIRSKLAFKAVNNSGEPVDVEGTLFENNEPIQKFKSFHAGMGNFEFIPDASKKYHIRLSQPSVDSTFLLPEIIASGMTLNMVHRNKDTLTFKIAQSPDNVESDFYVRAQCMGVVYAMATGKVTGEIRIKIPLALLPQGIAEVTLFNSDLVPVAERLVYINPERKLYIIADLSKDVIPTRGKVTLKITAKDESGYPVSANLGVSVFDKLYQNTSDSSNILSHIYLSSQLKGRIYNPSYYFNSKSKGRDEALDLLMLTQGWRKYIWSESNLKSSNETREKVIFDEIRGELFNPKRKGNIPKEQMFVMEFSINKDSLSTLIATDSAGRFSIFPDRLKVMENDYVYIKPFGPRGSNLKIKLNDPFKTINQIMAKNEVSFPYVRLSQEKKVLSDTIRTNSDVVRIKEITIKGEKDKRIHGKFLGTLDSLARLDLIPIGVATDDYVCKYAIWNCKNHSRFDIGSSKPVEGRRYIDNWGASHVLISHHAYQELTEEELLKKYNLSRVKAYYGRREFYQPNYDQETEEVLIPDFRNTLLWEPSVITDEKGEAILSFFCSDINTNFVGRIEGVGGNGLLGAGYFSFSVWKETDVP